MTRHIEIDFTLNKPGPSILPWMTQQPVDSYAEGSIENYLEYLDGPERIEFFNRLSELMMDNGKVHITIPYHSHPRSFADWALKWPPISEHSFLFLSKTWREQRPYTQNLGYTCDFEMYSYEYEMVDDWTTRHDAARTFGAQHYLGVITRLFVTLAKPSQAVPDQENEKSIS